MSVVSHHKKSDIHKYNVSRSGHHKFTSILHIPEHSTSGRKSSSHLGRPDIFQKIWQNGKHNLSNHHNTRNTKAEAQPVQLELEPP